MINKCFREDSVASEKQESNSGSQPEVHNPEKRISKTMERGLHERDRVGVQDFVLLEDFESEEAFIENLRKRFRENLIYVSKQLKYTNEMFH